MGTRRFTNRQPTRKFIPCSCGSDAKLIKHRNFPFGRKSNSVTTEEYKCLKCNKRYPLNRNQEVKK